MKRISKVINHGSIVNKKSKMRKEIARDIKKKFSPQEEKKLKLLQDFFNQNQIDPQSGQLVHIKEFGIDICYRKDLK